MISGWIAQGDIALLLMVTDAWIVAGMQIRVNYVTNKPRAAASGNVND